jgi:hypothetical protein
LKDLIIIEEDKEFEKEFEQAAIKLHQENNVKRANNGLLNIGDTTYCNRKSLIPIIFPSRAGLDIYEVDNFMRGDGAEHSIVKILEYMNKEKDKTFQLEILFDKITGHPDFVINGETVFELKSTNVIKDLDLESSNLKSYIRQITYYMLLTGIEKGRIIIKYGLPFEMQWIRKDAKDGENIYKVKYRTKSNKSPYYHIKLTISKDAEIRTKIKDILTQKIKPVLDQAIKNRDLTIIPVVDGKKAIPMDWMCSYCKHKEICDSIPDKQNDPELRNILLNKHIDNLVAIK